MFLTTEQMLVKYLDTENKKKISILDSQWTARDAMEKKKNKTE